MKVAVVAHAGKTVGGGLPELRRKLADSGVTDPLWTEVPKSKRAPVAVEEALEDGAELLIAWGGDGMMRRFAVMAGVGFDAAMIKASDDLKERLGRAAYVVGGASKLDSEPFEAKIKIDGTRWYEGPASCILVGNVGELFGGIEVFADAQPDDGVLDVGVLTSEGPVQLVRAAARTAVGSAEKSPFVRVTQGREVRVKLDRKVRYELDGGDRKKVKSFKVEVEPEAITVCVPRPAQGGSGA